MDAGAIIQQLTSKRESLLKLLDTSPSDQKLLNLLAKIDEKLSLLKGTLSTSSSESSSTPVQEKPKSPPPDEPLDESVFTVGSRCMARYKGQNAEAVVVDSDDESLTLRLVELGPLIKLSKEAQEVEPHPEGRFFSPGDLVLARYSQDKKFYPARIQRSFSSKESSYLVEFLSYNNFEQVKAEFIQPVPESKKEAVHRLTLSAGEKRQKAFEERDLKRKKQEEELDKVTQSKKSSWLKFSGSSSKSKTNFGSGRASGSISRLQTIQSRQGLKKF
ncbi:hypothetical protein P9112_007678 [Eukaryota sp. TZLM1-RC]